MARSRYPRLAGSVSARALSRAAFVASGGFIASVGAALSAVIESNLVTLQNLVGSVALTVAGGEYSKNGAAYSTAATTVANGDTLKLRVAASASAGSTTSVTATIGGSARTFSVSTAAAVVTPTPPPTVTPTLTLTGPLAFTAGVAAGTLVATIGNVPAGATPALTPADGRLVIAGDAAAGWKVVVGMTASSAGSIALTASATGATNASVNVTVSATGAVAPFQAITWPSEITAQFHPDLSGTAAELSTKGFTKVGTAAGAVNTDGNGLMSFTSTDTLGVGYTYDTGSVSHIIEGRQAAATNGAVPFGAIVTDPANFYASRLDTAGLTVTSKVAGTFNTSNTNTGSQSGKPVPAYVRQEIYKGKGRTYYNGQIVQNLEVPAALIGETKAGIISRAGAVASAIGDLTISTGRINHGHDIQGIWTGFAASPIYGGGKVFGGTARLYATKDARGMSQAWSVDTATGATAIYPLISGVTGAGTGWGDEHNSAGIIIRPDGRLIAFYCGHADTNGMRYRVSVNPYDVTAWSAESLIPSSASCTYNQPFYNPIDGTVTVWTRPSNRGISYYSSADLATVSPATADGGALGAVPTWSAAVNVIPLPTNSVQGIYASVGFDTATGRYDLLATNSVDAANSKLDARHAYYVDGRLYNSVGTAINAGTGGTFSNMTAVGTSAGADNFGNMLVQDVCLRPGGRIEAIFYTIVSYAEHHYYHASFDGTAWSKREIPNSVSGCIDDPSAPNTGSRVSGARLDLTVEGRMYVGVGGHDVSDIYAYSTPDRGATWDRVRVSPPANPTSLSTTGRFQNTNCNVYPRSVRNGTAKAAVMWCRGFYNYYDDTNVGGHATDLFSAGSDGTSIAAT